MSATELAQLETLAQIDDLIARLAAWAERPTAWGALKPARLVLKRLLDRVDPLRIRMDAPLVVATFGGTGVGKSSLVNALIGEEIAAAGRQRPTTTQPTLIAHTETNLDPYGFPIGELRVVQRDARLLRDWLIIDCPDPDTSETEDAGTNLARLHRILPFCDVLLYVSTQQKYRSARVGAELAQAADGCKLIFVQTHADRDSDIRADWRLQLEPAFRIADMFFVDSRQALAEQQQGLRPSGDFGRLLDVLLQELSTAQRVRIRQGNLFGLVHAALEHSLEQLTQTSINVRRLQTALQEQRCALSQTLSRRLETELLASRGMWERRLLGDVSQRWGMSPFALVLRGWHSQASLLASVTLMRARSSVQVALWGVMHGAHWLASRQREHHESQQFDQTSMLQLSEADLREAQLIIEGHARAAMLDREIVADAAARMPRSAAFAEDEFWSFARRRLDDEIAEAASRHSGFGVRFVYEVGFALLPVWLLYRIGKNFFYDSWWLERPLLQTNFYIPALLFLVLWTGLALMLFTGRLRRGMQQRVQRLAQELAQARLPGGLFPALETHCRDFHDDVAHLEELATAVAVIREQVAETPGLSRTLRAAESTARD